MSEYGAITPTTNGLTMITESVVKKKPIVFTKIAIGDGALTNQNIETLTALIRQKQEAPIHIVTDKGAGLADVSAVITNAGLSTGYYARELGVFAKVGDTGQEKLFAYTNAGANASYSPADGSLDEKLITVTFKIGTGATLKVALNSQVYLTLGNLEEHNTSSSAHADIRQLFKNYLPLTGGTVTGRLYVNDAVFMGTETSQYGNFIERSKAGTMYLASGKSESSNLSWFNMDGYFKYHNTAEMCVIKRDENANILARAFLLDQDNKTRFPGEVYSDEKLLSTKEYVDGKKWGSTSITDGAVTPTKLDRAYLPLAGGTVSGRTHIDAMLSVGQSSAEASNIRVDGAAGNAYMALLNYNNTNSLLIDGYFNNPKTATIDVTNRNAEGTVRYRSTLMDGNGNAKFANDVYANEKLLSTKEYVDGKKWGSTSITDGAVTPTKLDRAYLPLTGGTLTGTLTVAGINGISHDIASGGGTSGGNLNLGNATKTKSTALCCQNRPIWWNNTSSRNLALEEDINTHNGSSGAHSDIRRMFNSYLPLTGGMLTGTLSITAGSGNPVHFIKSGGGSQFKNLDIGSAQNTSKVALSCLERPIWYNDNVGVNDLALVKDLTWKKLYSVNRDAFTMPASGTALCDIPSTWKELHITWVWRGAKSTINTVVGYETYTINIVNEATGDPIVFVAPSSEGFMTVNNNKLYIIHRGDSSDGAPVLVMWR